MNSEIITNVLNQICFDMPAFIVVILIHEYFHYLAASVLLGEESFRNQQFNFVCRVDLFGTLLPFCLILSGYPLVFGWGKRFEADFSESEKKTSCEILFAFSGIVGNLLVCLVTGLFITMAPKIDLLYSLTKSHSGIFFLTFIFRLFAISLAVMLINFLPVPPFDGARLLFNVFDHRLKKYEGRLQMLGLLIVTTLILTGIGGMLFFAPFKALTDYLCGALAPYVIKPGLFARDFLIN
ncbi:MAG: site-2 protease family protein [Candidatus Rifleibacteriota bacterium]